MKTVTRSGLAVVLGVAWLCLAGCAGGGAPIQPATIPENAPAAGESPAAPLQTQLPPPPPEVKLAPLPTAAKRVMVCVTERVGQSESSRRDPESESIISEGLLAASGDLGIEVVKRGAFDEIIERDFEALIGKGLDENAQVLSNLLKVGVEYLALGEIGASELGREVGKRRSSSTGTRSMPASSSSAPTTLRWSLPGTPMPATRPSGTPRPRPSGKPRAA
jgi:hypothetical protein